MSPASRPSPLPAAARPRRRRRPAARLLLAALVVAGGLAAGWRLAAVEPRVLTIEPPFADRLFPFVALAPVFATTPAAAPQAVVAGCVFVVGEAEGAAVVAAAGRLAYQLGNWVEETGAGTPHPGPAAAGDGGGAPAADTPAAGTLPPLMTDAEARALAPTQPLVVVGTQNSYVRELAPAIEGPAIRLVVDEAAGGRPLLLLLGTTPGEVMAAADALAVRLAFKAGAYHTFYAFVRLRAYLEHANWEAAASVVRDPNGLAACGRAMEIAAPMVATRFPEPARAMVAARNEILYQRLPDAIARRAGDEALGLWRDAARTCYACHQGQDNVPQLRKFTPPEVPHLHHQAIALGYGLLDQDACATCHEGKTTLRGYQVFE